MLALTAVDLKRGDVREMGIRPDFVRSVVGAASLDVAAELRSQEAEPMVGWPAKGSSVSVMNMSTIRSEEGESDAEWIKTVSERLNSRAMSCFWACERMESRAAGRKTMARGFPGSALRRRRRW